MTPTEVFDKHWSPQWGAIHKADARMRFTNALAGLRHADTCRGAVYGAVAGLSGRHELTAAHVQSAVVRDRPELAQRLLVIALGCRTVAGDAWFRAGLNTLAAAGLVVVLLLGSWLVGL